MGKAKWIGEPMKCGHPGCADKQAQPYDGFCPVHLQKYFAPPRAKRTRPASANR
jgi:hypothetical protein